MAAAIGDIVTQEYAALLREYRVLQVTGDSYDPNRPGARIYADWGKTT
jgi:hypothetical protein